MDPRDLIKRPVITERSTELMEENKYVFEVDRRANKVEIRKAIEKLFDVKVVSVNTLNQTGKVKRVGKYVGRTQDRKKAIVKLAPDSKPINFFGES
ncbi:LSU ribosomal protein L23P [Alicyclobacillus sacchari]|uniref:Large ribosomal subunit protein uL23 n=2 Tax=Alicyclobacillus TaxID=29330 RepID=A0A1H2VJ36_9BACL|nr:50S ribosomal protein L23 [Alicyclobacillus tengchongensis]TDY42803.1 LSU ribosomal protein L23P [Alicyclobacillus sacchari]SDW68376.1 LSU ribosomal protein L23P [Alicyclobacillus hesperidum]GLG02598.1 50S ribosomal protein L23 [Alicyclobacillus hesperidum subsp. aegles]GLV12925.1 50S ribosomal protein L23 [Alicyclobacillus hesperidum]